MVTNEKTLININISNASKSEIQNWFESFGTIEYSIDEDLRYWLTTSNQTAPLASLPAKPPALLKPPGEDPLPSPWAVKDIGRSIKGGQIIESNDWTFYGGHDPEDYRHFVGDPPTDLSLHRNSPGYRLILNNILFPAARKKEKKT